MIGAYVTRKCLRNTYVWTSALLWRPRGVSGVAFEGQGWQSWYRDLQLDFKTRRRLPRAASKDNKRFGELHTITPLSLGSLQQLRHGRAHSLAHVHVPVPAHKNKSQHDLTRPFEIQERHTIIACIVVHTTKTGDSTASLCKHMCRAAALLSDGHEARPK